MSLDTKVKNLIINTNMTKEQYEAIDDKSNQLFFVEDSSVVDVPAPEENKSGYLHTDGVNLTWEEIESGDYLPLSGGTMTGPINIYQENTNYQKRSIFTTIVKPTDTAASGNLFEIKQDQSSVYVPGFKVTGNIAPNTDESVDFGNASYHFKNVFTKYINAGRDDGPNYATDLYNITVPVKKGTMALLEDIPESTQLETLPVASSDNLNKIYQYTGETSETYTNGYFYKCIETDGVYSWTQVNVQGGGGSDLPDQTDNAGKFLQTDGTTLSWGDALVNQSPSTQAYAIGDYSTATTYGVAYGSNSSADGIFSVAIGYSARANADGAIQLGRYGTNTDANTFKVANYNGNFEMMSADGTIPVERMLKTVELVDSSVELAINTIYNAGEMASLSITFPTVDVRYTSQLNFTSGATATAFIAPDDIKWDGDSIVKGAFVPEINKRYVILFYYDGINICAIARG